MHLTWFTKIKKLVTSIILVVQDIIFKVQLDYIKKNIIQSINNNKLMNKKAIN